MAKDSLQPNNNPIGLLETIIELLPYLQGKTDWILEVQTRICIQVLTSHNLDTPGACKFFLMGIHPKYNRIHLCIESERRTKLFINISLSQSVLGGPHEPEINNSDKLKCYQESHQMAQRSVSSIFSAHSGPPSFLEKEFDNLQLQKHPPENFHLDYKTPKILPLKRT